MTSGSTTSSALTLGTTGIRSTDHVANMARKAQMQQGQQILQKLQKSRGKLSGKWVEISGLQGRAELNGTRAIALQFNRTKQRYAVQLSNAEVVLLKPSNLIEFDRRENVNHDKAFPMFRDKAQQNRQKQVLDSEDSLSEDDSDYDSDDEDQQEIRSFLKRRVVVKGTGMKGLAVRWSKEERAFEIHFRNGKVGMVKADSLELDSSRQCAARTMPGFFGKGFVCSGAFFGFRKFFPVNVRLVQVMGSYVVASVKQSHIARGNAKRSTGQCIDMSAKPEIRCSTRSTKHC